MTMMHSGTLVSPDGDNAPDLNDIAWGLSRQVRFVGHSDVPWTVMQHTFLMEPYVEPHMRPFVLLHDATEAVMTDMPRPYKDDALIAIEERLAERIARRYGLPYPMPEEIAEAVKHVDYMAACAEALVIGYENSDPRDWCKPWIEPVPQMLQDARRLMPVWSLWMQNPGIAAINLHLHMADGLRAWEKFIRG